MREGRRMNRRIWSLLASLALLLSMLPSGVWAEAAIASREERTALQAQIDQYGGVDAAMSAYAKSRLRFQRAPFASMANVESFGFRKAVQNVYDTGMAFTDFVVKYLVDAGISVSANDGDWALSENETRLFLEHLLLVAEMEAKTFEQIAADMQDYIPHYCAGEGMVELGLNLMTATVNSFAYFDEGILDDVGAVFARKYGAKSFGRKLFSHYGDIYEVLNNSADLAGVFNEVAEDAPALENLANSCLRVQAGRALIAAIGAHGVQDERLDAACAALTSGYADYEAELMALAGEENAAQRMADASYLDGRLNAHIEANLLRHPADTVAASVATILKCADVLATNGVGRAAFESVQSIGDLTLGTKSTFVHFQAMRSLDTLYAELLDAQRMPEDGAPWEDYYNYALSIQRLCKVALLGERHLYEMGTEDAGALHKLSGVQGEREAWYNGRVNTLQSIHNGAGEYMNALLAQHSKLSQIGPGIEPLLGHERELTVSFGGTVLEDLWFAKNDGSGEPDESKMNPDAGKPVAHLPVYLLAGETIIAQTTTDENGEYRFTVAQYEIEGKQTRIVLGDESSSDPLFAHMAAPDEGTEGTFAVREIGGVSGKQLAFRASYPYDLDAGESRSDADWLSGRALAPYADDDFLGDPKAYNHNLATVSLALSAASLSAAEADGQWTVAGDVGRDAHIRAAWRALGFDLVASGNYDLPLSEAGVQAGFTIAQKIIEDEDARNGDPTHYRVIGLAVQGDVATAQMASTLRAARDADGDQQGVGEAAQEIFDALAAQLAQEGDMPVVLLVTGFGRGGAIAGAVAQKICTTSALAYRWNKLFAYTFAAPQALASSLGEESRAGVFNIVYDEDPIASELYEGWFYARLGETLTFGETSVAYAQRIASAFYAMTGGNADYHPLYFEANRSALEAMRSVFGEQLSGPGEYAGEMQALATAVAQWTYLCGDLNAPVSLAEKHAQAIAVTGEPGEALKADVDALIEGAADGLAQLVVQALPQSARENLRLMLSDVLLLTAHNLGDMRGLTLSETAADNLIFLVSTLMGDMSSAASVHGLAFAHHPEVYQAWMLGMDGQTLFGREMAMSFDTLVLPQERRLCGRVTEVDPAHGDYQPCEGASVTAIGEDGTSYAVQTDENGVFVIHGAKAGAYTITASKGEHEKSIEFTLTDRAQYCGEIILGESALDIYYRYLKLEVAPKEGLASLNPVIGTCGFKQEHWPELAQGGAKGLVSAAVCDFDRNGTEDLVALYATNKALLVQDHWPEHFTYELRLYQIRDGEVVLADTVHDFLHIDNYIFDCFGPASMAIAEDSGGIHILGYTWQQSAYSYGSDMTACYRVENGRFVSEWADGQFAPEAAGMEAVRAQMEHLGGWNDAGARAWLGGMLATFAHFDLYGDLNEPVDYIYTMEDFTHLHAILGGDMKPVRFEPTALAVDE